MYAHRTAERRTRTLADTVASPTPAATQAVHAARSTAGLNVTTRRRPIGSACNARTTDRHPTMVEGRHRCSAASHTASNCPTPIAGSERRAARTTAANPAHRASSEAAVGASPRTVTDRCRHTPLTGSAPNATRTSHTPGLRSRSDPPPRGLFIHPGLPHPPADRVIRVR